MQGAGNTKYPANHITVILLTLTLGGQEAGKGRVNATLIWRSI